MMIYNSTLTAKNGMIIPVFADNKPMNSKYDPGRETDAWISSIQKKDFYILTGLGSGLYYKKLSDKFRDSFILIVENSVEDVNFLKENFPDAFKEIKNERTLLTTTDNLSKDLLFSFIPALYSSFELLEITSWCNQINRNKLIQTIQETIKTIGADFSVQAHFGKIWQKNILSNLKEISPLKLCNFDTSKKACIVAAGPSLDETVSFLREHSEDYCIFSTDTAYKTLKRNKIIPNAVISIDAQNVSEKHFNSKISKETLFVFNLCGNHSAVKKIKRNSGKVLFTISNHPFEQFIRKFCRDAFIETDCSSGTVTIAAIDFAKKAGFSELEVFGADFGYINNKPYAKGTYLDDIYSELQNKTASNDYFYSKLMYRTELIESENKYTTETLARYEEQFELWCKKNDFSLHKKNNIHYLSAHSSNKPFDGIINDFDCTKFYSYMQKNISLKENLPALLPLISFMKNADSGKGSLKSFDEYRKLALTYISRYNFKYE